jgi:hypothetical protein
MTYNLKNECDWMLKSLLGSELVAEWWQRPNRAFDGKTPSQIWEIDPEKVYQYLAHAGNAEG